MRALLKQSQAQITKLYVDLYFIIQPNKLSLISILIFWGCWYLFSGIWFHIEDFQYLFGILAADMQMILSKPVYSLIPSQF